MHGKVPANIFPVFSVFGTESTLLNERYVPRLVFDRCSCDTDLAGPNYVGVEIGAG